MSDEKLPTGSVVIDEMLEGGLPRGATSGVFALPDVGKTWLTHQIAVSNLKHSDKGSLIIETEAYKDVHYNRYSNIFYKRFEVDDKKVDYIHVRGLKDLCELFGLQYKKEDDGKKIRVYIHELSDKEKSSGKFPLALKDAVLKKYSFIGIDSFSKPFKGEISGGTADFPARAQISDRLFYQFDNVYEKYNMALFVTVHASKDPTSPFSRPHQYGAETLLYNCKFLLGLINADKETYEKWGDEGRRVVLKRYPGVPTVTRPVQLKYNYGFV